MNIIITGTSRGIGHALANYYKELGNVIGINRTRSDLNIEQIICDINDHSNLKTNLNEALVNIDRIDLLILNAGVLGNIQSITESKIEDLKKTMDTNLWSQKFLLDIVLQKEVKNVIAISSGAAIKGTYGWSGYSLSKTALNMLIQLYADEYKGTKFIALAPGLVHTQMQEELAQVDISEFTNIKRIHDARGTENMPTPDKFIGIYQEKIDKILNYDSGSFIDIRKI